MTLDLTDPVDLTQALIRCASVTPADEGALAVAADALEHLGFTCHPLRFQETPDSPPIANLFAFRGDPAGAGRHLAFAGHTDVVPPGDAAAWRHPPFAATVEEGQLYGRGAVDMKGSIGAFLAALARWDGALPSGACVSLILTGDEEGPAINGTEPLMRWIAERGWTPDACIVGEPTNPDHLGQMIKIGRRGSITAHITVRGVQGHVAYPHRADNPCTRLVAMLAEMTSRALDDGTAHFPPSTLAITTIDVGNPAHNVIPAQARATVNIRFNDQHSGDSLGAWLTAVCQRHAPGQHSISLHPSAEPFLTPPGPLSDMVSEVVEAVTGHRPELGTTGGTSDARFIARHCPVVEFGGVGRTMHQVDEAAAVADLEGLTDIYRSILERAFAD